MSTAAEPSTTTALPVIITEGAATEMKRALEQGGQTETHMLRVGIKSGGCSGFEYNFFFDEVDNADSAKDYLGDAHGVKVAVDKKSALFLEGTTIGFHEDINRRGFTFDNPNAVKSCGCGSSFSA